MVEIIFTKMIDISDDYDIVPAIKEIPEWYKKMSSYVNDENFFDDGPPSGTATIKKCMPVFDSMTAGYILKTYTDIHVSKKNNLPYYQWPMFDVIDFHPIEQAKNYPIKKTSPYAKLMSPWSISTPPGYSCLFLPPMHNPNRIFTVLPGIVDTDKYFAKINFPFYLNDENWEGFIPAGTPAVQIIPFKRDRFKMSWGKEKNFIESKKSSIKVSSLFYNSYKKIFRSEKFYI